MAKRTLKEHVRAAMNAQTNLNMFGAVCVLMENSLTVGPSNERGDATAAKIIALCQAEMRRQLIRMDKATDGVQDLTREGAIKGSRTDGKEAL